MTSDKYILSKDGTTPVVAEGGLLEWATWKENNREASIVAKDHIGNATVSTIFLGLDHNWSLDGPPILWETMVFGGPLDGEQDRCSGLRQDALHMHEMMVARVEVARLPWNLVRLGIVRGFSSLRWMVMGWRYRLIRWQKDRKAKS